MFGNFSEELEYFEMVEVFKIWFIGGMEYKWWEVGGGGMVWDFMVYDLEFNFFYVGVGNGLFWMWWECLFGGGDNLYLFFIIVFNFDMGIFVWYY